MAAQLTASRVAAFRRVGWALIAVGSLDVCVMVYAVSQGQSYASSLNIFAIVAGVFVQRGNLRALRLVTWSSAFFASAVTLGSLLVLPWVLPFEYWLLEAKRTPIALASSLLIAAASVAFSSWVYLTLRSGAVLHWLKHEGQGVEPPRSAFAATGALVAVVASTQAWIFNSEAREQAIQLAIEEYGAEYNYGVVGWSISGPRTTVTLVAYNAAESKSVKVEWID